MRREDKELDEFRKRDADLEREVRERKEREQAADWEHNHEGEE
jgi:hypothetical protein